MTDSLVTYIRDHLSGSRFAVELLERLRDQHPAEPIGDFASGMLSEVEQDRQVLEDILARVDHGIPMVREAASWVAEKAAEFKLKRGAFGTFEALELLALGILGKLKGWEALKNIAQTDDRLRGINFDTLSARARRQHIEVEKCRLETIPNAFADIAEPSASHRA